jgi:hypothetical protein
VRVYKEKKKKDYVETVTSELKIARPRQTDQGSYTCIATNKGGRDQFELMVEVPAETLIQSNYPSDGGTFVFIYILIVLIFFILVVAAIVFICCYCKKQKDRQKNLILSNEVNGGLTSTKVNKMHNDSILEGGSVIMEMQTSLLTEVNPVEKPPRRADVDSITKETDDISDAKQILLDDSTCGEYMIILFNSFFYSISWINLKLSNSEKPKKIFIRNYISNKEKLIFKIHEIIRQSCQLTNEERKPQKSFNSLLSFPITFKNKTRKI